MGKTKRAHRFVGAAMYESSNIQERNKKIVYLTRNILEIQSNLFILLTEVLPARTSLSAFSSFKSSCIFEFVNSIGDKNTQNQNKRKA